MNERAVPVDDDHGVDMTETVGGLESGADPKQSARAFASYVMVERPALRLKGPRS